MKESDGERRFWIIVSSAENFARTASLGFTVKGLKSRHRKKADRMRPGDRFIYYVTGKKAFAAVATVKSRYFESHERIWESSDASKGGEEYPFRVKISADLVLDSEQFQPAEELARQMDYARKWPAEHWTLAFQGNVHEVHVPDFELIRGAIASRASGSLSHGTTV
ncbi:MAG: EVE domain-containing protein [Chloroflexota bacterium]|nr:EVE domain-containing protein [Chloroflexota bacterium]